MADPDATALADAIRSGRRTAEAAVRDSLRLLDTVGRELNCVAAVLAEPALHAAGDLDHGRTAPETGALRGVPFGVKELFDVAGMRTTSGSTVDAARPPARRHAVAVQALVTAGAIPVATLTMDEFAHGFTTQNPHYGVCLNPRDRSRIAGGSSGGSAAAVAAGLVPFSLGSDTNGSIRVPASLCGVVGLKPTFGRVPTTGMTPFAATLDHAGALTRSVRDAAAILDVLTPPGGHIRPALVGLGNGLGDLRVAACTTDSLAPYASPHAIAVLDRAMDLLGVRERVALLSLDAAMNASLLVTAAEAGAYHLDRLRAHAADYGSQTRAGLLAGAILPSAALVAAQRYRDTCRSDLDEIFSRIDVLLLPTTPCPAPLARHPTVPAGHANLPANPYLGVFTIPFSFTGAPAVSVPVPIAGGLPVGVQVVSAPDADATALRVAAALEARAWDHPPEAS